MFSRGHAVVGVGGFPEWGAIENRQGRADNVH